MVKQIPKFLRQIFCPPRLFITVPVLALLILLLAYTIAVSAPNVRPSWLTRSYGPNPTYTVWYATTCPPAPTACTASELVPTTDANHNGTPDVVEAMSGYVEDSRRAFVTTFSMREPYFSLVPREARMTGGCWGYYTGEAITACAARTSSDPVQAKATAVHELYHALQAAYYHGQPTWVIEGQAAFIEDEVFADLDANPGTFLVSTGNVYLGYPNNQSLTSTGYPACWFWKYFASRFGTTPNPSEGMDVIKRFWDVTDSSHLLGPDTINRVLSDLGSGETFQSVFQDFAIMNYARKLSGPMVVAKYRVPDEAEPQPGPLHAVSLDLDQPLSASGRIGPTLTNVNAWGLRYYSITPAAGVSTINIDVAQSSTSTLFFAILGVRGTEYRFEYRNTGRNLHTVVYNDHYDHLVLVVGGLDSPAYYNYTFTAHPYSLNIVDPLTSRPALVTAGTPAIRDALLVKVEALTGSGERAPGLTSSAFTVTVGSRVVPASDVLASTYVQNQQWLLMRAPALPAGAYDLRVQWQGLSDTETRAISYTNRATADHMIVLDRSGSMGIYDKLPSATAAARLYIDSWRDGDRIGVVSFNEAATTNYQMAVLNATTRTNAKTSFNTITPSGTTSIGGGALAALDELIARGSSADRWAIVLLSDGQENTAPWISDFMTTYNARKHASPPQKVPVVHTVALGADAERSLLQRLARDTSGTYQYAPHPSGAASQAGPDSPEAVLPLDLALIYRNVAEAVDPQQQIYAQQHYVDKVKRVMEAFITVDPGATEAQFNLAWAQPYVVGNFKLYQPDSSEYGEPTFSDDTHLVWQVTDPPAGTWKLLVDCTNIGSCAENYLVEAALKSALLIDLYFTPDADPRLQGQPVDILAVLADDTPIKEATVNATITAPDDVTIYNLPLWDDGLHGDGAAGDGLFANRFYQTFQGGSYIVNVVANGTSGLGSSFTRQISRAFDVTGDKDSDKDGMPDNWETENGTNPNKYDADADPDQDGLSNLLEYQSGTLPLDPDTDRGGQSDGSEVYHKLDPLDPADDLLRPPAAFNVYPGKGLNLLVYSVLPQYYHLELWGADNPDGPFSLINDKLDLSGYYTHTGLTNGQAYYYRLAAVGKSGETSTFTAPAGGTPQEQPLLPGGIVKIKDQEGVVSSLNVTLAIEAQEAVPPDYPGPQMQALAASGVSLLADQAPSAAPAEMRISNDPTFSDAAWEPYAITRQWQLASAEGPSCVYIQFRAANGNLSEAAGDCVTVTAANKLWMPIVVKKQ